MEHHEGKTRFESNIKGFRGSFHAAKIINLSHKKVDKIETKERKKRSSVQERADRDALPVFGEEMPALQAGLEFLEHSLTRPCLCVKGPSRVTLLPEECFLVRINIER